MHESQPFSVFNALPEQSGQILNVLLISGLSRESLLASTNSFSILLETFLFGFKSVYSFSIILTS